MLFSTWLNPEHEVVGRLVSAGVAISVAGALMVSIDTGLIVSALVLPERARPRSAVAGVSA